MVWSGSTTMRVSFSLLALALPFTLPDFSACFCLDLELLSLPASNTTGIRFALAAFDGGTKQQQVHSGKFHLCSLSHRASLLSFAIMDLRTVSTIKHPSPPLSPRVSPPPLRPILKNMGRGRLSAPLHSPPRPTDAVIIIKVPKKMTRHGMLAEERGLRASIRGCAFGGSSRAQGGVDEAGCQQDDAGDGTSPIPGERKISVDTHRGGGGKIAKTKCLSL